MAQVIPTLSIPSAPPTNDPALGQWLTQFVSAVNQWVGQVANILQQQNIQGNFTVTYNNIGQACITITDSNGNGVFVNGSGPVIQGQPEQGLPT